MNARRSRDVLALKIAFVTACAAIVYFRLGSGFFWYGLLAVASAASLARGRMEERVAAGGIVLASAASLAAWPHYWAINHAAILAIDAALAVVLAAVAVRSELWWPSWSAAFQTAAVGNHVVYAVWPDRIELWSYASGVQIWSWLVLLPFSLGAFDACLARAAQSQAMAPAAAGATRR